MMKKKNRKSKNNLKLTLLLILLFIAGLFFIKWISLPVDPESQKEIAFSIEKGESIDAISDRLKEADLIRSKAAFKIAVLRHRLSKNIQAGDFFIKPSLNIDQVVKTLTVGRSDIKVTLLEGWRREEIAAELTRQLTSGGSLFDGQEFLTLSRGKEGHLFPDTYFFPKDVTAQLVVDTLISNFNNKVNQKIRADMKKQGLTLEEALIFASIIEREVRTDADRPLVAGILIKRFQNNWPLQADATVQYALGFQKQSGSWWKKDLTKLDLETESPYNTYSQTGLIPAPICNPSLASIQAVADQESSEFWFYLSDSKGKLHYAKTIEGHNRNIKNYLNK